MRVFGSEFSMGFTRVRLEGQGADEVLSAPWFEQMCISSRNKALTKDDAFYPSSTQSKFSGAGDTDASPKKFQ
jgi:hypothetical protein